MKLEGNNFFYCENQKCNNCIIIITKDIKVLFPTNLIQQNYTKLYSQVDKGNIDFISGGK